MRENGITNYIGGTWTGAIDGGTFDSLNPARTAEVIGTFSRSQPADVDAAARAAKDAYPAWRRLPAPARGAIISRAAAILEQRKEEIARQMTAEMGKVLVEARGDVQEAIDMGHYIAAFGRLPNGSLVPSERADVFCAAKRVPIGVVGMITPWNFPIAIPSWKMFPALLAGNTIVFKPAEDTPGLAATFVEVLIEAGIPPGVVNMVTGFGEEAGAALVEHPAIPVISFTGSTEVGRKIAARCGALMKRVSCELGGKNAIVVLDDADVELAVKGALWSAFGTSGQRCTAASRLIVQSGVYRQFRDQLVDRTKALRLGHGIDPNTDVGPVINRSQLDRIHEYTEIGRAEGAAVAAGGAIADQEPLAGGCFYSPTVFDNMRPEMRIAQEEIFGPVTGIIRASDAEEAVRIANGTAYGLSLSVYTRDVPTAFRAMEELDAGIVYVNLPTSGAEIQLPFGGIKNTGNGHREAGWTAMDYCTEWKSIYVNYSSSAELVRAQIDTQES
jgi:aldehyde dehydrogenase (NAD+)